MDFCHTTRSSMPLLFTAADLCCCCYCCCHVAQAPVTQQASTEQTQEASAQHTGTRAKQVIASPDTLTGLEKTAGGSVNKADVAQLHGSVDASATTVATTAVADGAYGLATCYAATAAADELNSATSMFEINRLRLDNQQLAGLVAQLLKESADTRAAAALATTAAANQSAATKEALACLQAQMAQYMDSMNSKFEEVSSLARSEAAAAAAIAVAAALEQPHEAPRAHPGTAASAGNNANDGDEVSDCWQQLDAVQHQELKMGCSPTSCGSKCSLVR